MSNKKKLNIFLIRGLTRESGHWGEFLPFLESYLPEAKINLLDLPGAGVHVNSKASCSARKMVEFIRMDALDRIDPDAFNIICATSLAGVIAIEWTLNYNNDFDGMIMIASSVGGICTPNERAHKSVRGDMFEILFTPNIELRERLVIKVNSNKDEMTDKLLDDWLDIQRKRKMTRLNIFRQTLAGIIYRTKGRKPEMPVLIIGSKGDRMVSTSCIEKMHAYFGGQLIWHETSGHGLPLDEPEWLSKTVADWSRARYSEDFDKTLSKS